MNDETRISKITDSIDKEVLGTLPVDIGMGGVQPFRYTQMLDLAKTMATAKHSIRAHLRGNPGDCLAIWDMAMNSGLAPYALARHCYVVNDILCFEAQVINALINKHAPLKEHLRDRYDGEGEEMRITISGHFKGELDPREYTSPPIGQINPKNSPLWKSDPGQQLWYFGVRRWARRHCPEILLGVFTKDELEDSGDHFGPEDAKDVSPNLLERLPGRIEGAGFDPVQSPEQAKQEQEAIEAVVAAKEAKSTRSLAMAKAWVTRRQRQKAPQSATEGQGMAVQEKAAQVPYQDIEPIPGPAAEGQRLTLSEVTREAIAIEPMPPLPDKVLSWEPPTTQAEYVQYAQRAFRLHPDPQRWFTSRDQVKLREACGVSEMIVGQLSTLAASHGRLK